MANKTILIILVLGVAILSGCVDSKTVYFCTTCNQTMTLYGDHTVTSVGSGESSSGTWKYDGNDIVTSWIPFGNINIFKPVNNTYVDKDGDVWVKK